MATTAPWKLMSRALTKTPQQLIFPAMEESSELFSKPLLSTNGTVPPDIVEYLHSFGYDCKRMHNLCVMETNVVVFASGNLIHFFNVDTLEVTTRRSSQGGGIGCIKKNPTHPHLVVAENGKFPPIYIFEYPLMGVVARLPQGTTFTYSCIDFSPDGELLVSQGGDPDYTLTVWRWREEEVVLKVKSFHNDILNLMFSPSVGGQITTCGFGHIKFWKMSHTFTGLKLHGDVGRFGKTEISDITGIFPMPDERVLSGCEWGNILVWEHGLITLEVCRKGRRRCHGGPITQIFARDGEIITIGVDGFIRIWFWETVDLADPPEHNRFVEIEPIYEYQIGGMSYTSELLCMQRVDLETQKHFLQDGNGGMWMVDISSDNKDAQAPVQFFQCHAGPIFTICASPMSPHVATFGRDGRLFMYDYELKKLVFCHQFISQGDDMIWLPITIDPSGVVIILAFDDGVIRVVCVNLEPDADASEPRVKLIQVIKSHSEPIRKLSINSRETILVSGGDDNMIFVHQIAKGSPFVTLIPIGLVLTPSFVTCLNWKPGTFSTILVGCKEGQVMEADLPEEPVTYTDISYRLTHVKPRALVFVSTKGQIIRDRKIAEAEKRRAEKMEKKRKELERIRRENPGANINEETFFEDSETEEEIEPAYVPKIPNRVLWAQYTPSGTLWLSMAGFDAGFVYEYGFEEGLIKCTPVSNAEDIEIDSFLYFNQYLIFGMGDGSLRVNRVKEDFTDLSDFWILNMHDNRYGNVNCMCFSFDRKYLFTGGADGNFFSYKWNAEKPEVPVPYFIPTPALETEAVDIDDICYLSLEEEKQKADHDHRMEVALARKSEVMKVISRCKEEYESLIKRNKALPVSQRIPWEEFELDSRITDMFQKRFDDEMALVKQKMAFEVEKVRIAGKKLKEYFLDPLDSFPIEVLGVSIEKSVKSFRIHKLDEEYHNSRADLEERIKKDAERRRLVEIIEEKQEKQEEERREKLESFLQGLTESDVDLRLDSKCRRLLKKYRARKAKEATRTKEWDELNALKPDPEENHPDDDRDLLEAEKTIGDYKLKTSPDFDPTELNRDTTLKKFKELLEVREQIYNIRKAFNDKVFELRDEKEEVFKYVEQKKRLLAEIHKELKDKEQKDPGVDVTFDIDLEYPEKAFQLETYMGPNVPLAEVLRAQLPPLPVDHLSDIQREIFTTELPDGEEFSTWEKELIAHRRQSQLYEQDRLIDRIKLRVSDFNEKLVRLSEERLQIEVDAKFLEQFLITLNQELWILKDFEQLEEELIMKMEQQVFERNRIHADMMTEKALIESKRLQITEYEERQNEIEVQFQLKCKGDPYWKYFRKIFYKRWKPPKNKNEDEDQEYKSESDSDNSELYPSSSEEEAETLHSESSGTSYKMLNENRCPDNCNEELFDLAHESRRRYHNLQSGIVADEAKVILATEAFEALNAKMGDMKRALDATKKELVEFRRNKQKFLNTIETLVVLKMDQLQYFRTADEIDKIEDTLLFSNANIAKLYTRVGQLALETLEVKRKHRVNVVHLSRMKADIKFMEQQIVDLKEEINSTMVKKFGRVVDLDELEEAILRRFVYEMRTNKEDVKKEYAKKIAKVKKALAAKQEELAKTIQEGTEKLNILTVLQEEKNYLTQVLLVQRKMEDKATSKVHLDYKKDVLRLREIARHQQEQITAFQKDIRGMSHKCAPAFGSTTSLTNIKTPDQRVQSPPQPFRQNVFEDSVYTNIIESRADSSKCSTPNMELFREMSRIVKMFFVKSLRSQADCSQIQTITCTLARYLTNIATSFTPETADKLLPEIIQNFQSFIPDEVLSQIPKGDIAKLIEDVVGSFREEFDIEPRDVIQEIIAVSCEGLTKGHERYFQTLLTEIVKQMVVTMRVHDLRDELRLKEVAFELKQRGLNFCSLPVKDVAIEVAKYAAENYLDDVDYEMVRFIVDKIVTLCQQQ